MLGLKLRKTNIIAIIKESLSKISLPDNINFVLESSLDDEAVWIDHEQMATVFSDLAQNSVEAMPAGGVLRITVDGDEQRINITLTDTGSGISAENMPLLFTPFFTTKPVGEGSGLSLPMAYAAVKTYRGDIFIESNADSHLGPTGTTVKISLPRHAVLPDIKANVIVHGEEVD